MMSLKTETMNIFENDLQRLTFLKRTIAMLSSMVDGGECHTARSKEMKNNALQVILEMEANVVESERQCDKRKLLIDFAKEMQHIGLNEMDDTNGIVDIYISSNL